MEKPGFGGAQLAIVRAVLFLGSVAFSCCLAAEFNKSKVTRDMKVDGNRCSLPRSPAFALGVTALVCLSVAQIAGTTAAGARICSGDSRRSRATPIALLVLSWVSFALAAILLGTASSMSNKQAYGRGWLDGDCYLVKDGVYAGSAVLAVSTVVFILGFTFSATRATSLPGRRTGPSDERPPLQAVLSVKVEEDDGALR
ncbi:hypothetical protein AXF42_Ash004221 [Apostasia shenzhenica]|uniref:Uncharacterized protein n=1 Tax=Apostasia shenzhenica TaxID=1088818 RepID=A0A2I0A2A5_9ASPA|nr:hypothetical protein AXF42_Ash004221 [Apostasia shenzhenica]